MSSYTVNRKISVSLTEIIQNPGKSGAFSAVFLLDFKMKKLHGKKMIPMAVVGFTVFFIILFV